MAWRVLVIESNKNYRGVMAQSLAKWGYCPDFSTNGKIALKKLAREKDIFLIVVDWHLPKNSGAEFCLELRRKIQRPIYVIALNGRITQADIGDGLKAGINGYLPKPIPLTELECLLGRGCDLVTSDLGYKQGVRGGVA